MDAKTEQHQNIVVRFAGDSGDGMQLTGTNFTLATALYGNNLSTFPDFPAEIRAPVGATFGVSAFQIYFGSEDVTTAGDEVEVLVAMNPAALITNLKYLIEGGLVIVDTGAFNAKNLAKAKYLSNPLEDGSLQAYKVLAIDIHSQVIAAVEEFGLSHKMSLRCKNMWTLGLVFWLFDRDKQSTIDGLKAKFANKPDIANFQIDSSNECVYIADNPKKDFITPNALGWLTIQVNDSGRNIHPQDITVKSSQKAKLKVNQLKELVNYV